MQRIKVLQDLQSGECDDGTLKQLGQSERIDNLICVLQLFKALYLCL